MFDLLKGYDPIFYRKNLYGLRMILKKFFKFFEYFGRFSFVGAINTALYFLSTNLIIFFEFASTFVASNISYTACIMISFLGHSNFTFKIKNIEISQFKRFSALSCLGLLISNSIIFLNANYFLFSSYLIVSLITITIPIINFFFLKYWVFRA